MQPLQDVLTDPSDSGVGSEFFSRPPLRSVFFIMGTLLMLMALAVACFVLVRNWNELPTMSVAQMGLATATMLILWFLSYQIFERLYELYSQAKLDPSFVRSPIDKVLRSAGNLMFATLFFGFMAATWFLFALNTALCHR
jgi:hypothetical protein